MKSSRFPLIYLILILFSLAPKPAFAQQLTRTSSGPSLSPSPVVPSEARVAPVGLEAGAAGTQSAASATETEHPDEAVFSWYRPSRNDLSIRWNRQDPWEQSYSAHTWIGYHGFFGGDEADYDGTLTLGIRMGLGTNFGFTFGTYTRYNWPVFGFSLFQGLAWKVFDFRQPDLQLGVLGPLVELRGAVYSVQSAFGSEFHAGCNINVGLSGGRLACCDLGTVEIRPILGTWFADRATSSSGHFVGASGLQLEAGVVF